MRLETRPQRQTLLAMTSLVDVVFILLFFFMLAARPGAVQQLELQFADAAPGAPAAAELVALSGERVRWSGRDWPAAELAERLRLDAVAQVRLGADAAASLQDLLRAFDALRAAGIRVQITAGSA